MKKLFAIAICTILCIALAIPALAASQAANLDDYTPSEAFADTFDSAIDSSVWAIAGGTAVVENGVMYLGKNGGWTSTGYGAYADTTLANGKSYSLEFDFTGNRNDCYYGVAIRCPGGTAANFMNGGRYGIPGGAGDTSRGICFDLHISTNQNKEAGGKMLGITLNNGQINADAAQFLVDYPEGFNGSAGHVKIVDTVDKVTLYIDGTEIATLVLSGLENEVYTYVTAYDAAGEKLYEGDCEAPAANTRFGFYQRNNVMGIDNVTVTHLRAPGEPEVRDFSSEKGDNLSYDQILYNNDEMQANGTAAVNELKVLVDGSDGSIEKVTMYGWYGNRNSKTVKYGYKVDGGEPVYDAGFFFETTEEDQNAIAGVYPNGRRFKITVDVSGYTDGKTHRIDAVAVLENGDIVTLNRNEDGKDREVFINYKSVAGVFVALDYFKVNGTGTNYPKRESGDEITIFEGDTLKAVGWAFKYGTNLNRVYWQYVDKGGKINQAPINDCSDIYRSRNDVAGVFGYSEADFQYFKKSGFGLDTDYIDLVGVKDLAVGTYDVRFVAEFEDGTTEVIKKKFTLNVVAQPLVKVIVGTEETMVKPNYYNQIVLSAADGKLVCTTEDGASDPWVSIPLDNIDTNVYYSFTVKYAIDPSTVGNNVYLCDTEVNKGYSGVSGTWCAPDMNGKTEKTYVIATDFPTMAGTTLTGVRFPCAPAGGTLTIESITFNKLADPEMIRFNKDVFQLNNNVLTAAGWAGANYPANNLGYKIDGGENIFDMVEFRNFNTPDEKDIIIGLAGENAFRFATRGSGIDLSELSNGEHTVTLLLRVTVNGQNAVLEMYTETVNISSEQDPASIRTYSFNTVFVNGELYCDTGDALAYLNSNPVTGEVNSIGIRGWAWINNSEIESFGYKLDGGEPVYSEGYLENRGDVYGQSGATPETANGFNINPVDASALANGDHTITAVIKAKDGTVLEIVTAPFSIEREIPVTEKELETHVNIDAITVDGQAQDKTDPLTINVANGVDKVNFHGWVAANEPITKYGYRVDGGEIVYFEGELGGDDADSVAIMGAAKGLFGEEDGNGYRYSHDIPLDEGEHTLELIALCGDEEVAFFTINYTRAAAEQPVTEPETQPQTGDAAVAMFAVIAVLAMGAAVVFVKKRAF